MIATSLFENGRYLALLVISIIVVGVTSYNSLGRGRSLDYALRCLGSNLLSRREPCACRKLVQKPLEDALREHPDVQEIDSSSINGVSTIVIEADYYLSRSDIKRVWSELRGKVDRVTADLPEGTTQPVFDDDLFTTFVKIVAISADEGVDISPSLLRREALRFADAARKVPQTRRVKPYGLPDEEINVEINGTALSTLGLSVDDIARTLALSDSRTPAGKLASPTTALTIDVRRLRGHSGRARYVYQG